MLFGKKIYAFSVKRKLCCCAVYLILHYKTLASDFNSIRCIRSNNPEDLPHRPLVGGPTKIEAKFRTE